MTHYRRWIDHGDPLTILTDRGTPLIERFMKRVRVDDATGCWLWTGALQPSGYGAFSVTAVNGRRRAHRWSYEYHRGPVPEGLTIDHLCHDRRTCHGGPSCLHRRCVNPAHLEPVTPQENSARMARGTTKCSRGHQLPPYVEGGVRSCRTCATAAQRRYLARKAARAS